MKKIKITLIFLAAFGVHQLRAQADTVRIKTSALCQQCKDKIENDISFEKGVRYGRLDMQTKIVTVVYNPKKTDEQRIREAISKMGYDADNLPADKKAYSRLPSCCKRAEDQK